MSIDDGYHQAVTKDTDCFGSPTLIKAVAACSSTVYEIMSRRDNNMKVLLIVINCRYGICS